MDNWQLYFDNKSWYFNVWDGTKEEWETFGPYRNYDAASTARDATMLNKKELEEELE